MGECQISDCWEGLRLSFSLSVRKEAEADVQEAFEYYESCRAGLGYDLLLCIEASFSLIEKNPNQYKPIHKTVHRALVKRFPYGVFYVIKGNKVSVIGVVHARKNPGHWMSRA